MLIQGIWNQWTKESQELIQVRKIPFDVNEDVANRAKVLFKDPCTKCACSTVQRAKLPKTTLELTSRQASKESCIQATMWSSWSPTSYCGGWREYNFPRAPGSSGTGQLAHTTGTPNLNPTCLALSSLSPCSAQQCHSPMLASYEGRFTGGWDPFLWTQIPLRDDGRRRKHLTFSC